MAVHEAATGYLCIYCEQEPENLSGLLYCPTCNEYKSVMPRDEALAYLGYPEEESTETTYPVYLYN